MVMEIVHSAIARKMLCHPVNSLIAATELICSVGVMAKRLDLPLERAEKIAGLPDTEKVRQAFVTVLAEQNLTEFEESYQNLVEMIYEYRGEAEPFLKEYQELFWYAYREPLKFPKMNL